MQPALAALLVASTGHTNYMTHSKQGDAASSDALLVASTSHKTCMAHSKQGVCSQPLLHCLLHHQATRIA